MKKSFLSALENKYYYAVSRYFWHLIIAIGILGIGAGILVYFWTLVPPSKREVVKQSPPPKPKYPELKEITLQQIIQALPKKKKKISPPVTNPQVEETYEPETYREEEIVTIDSAALANFNRIIGQTKILIPVDKNKDFWNDQYKMVFNSERDKKMYRKTHNPNLMHTVLVSSGFKTKFINYTDREKLKSYYDKAELLSTYNRFIKNLDTINRKKFILNTGLKLPVKSLGTKEIDKRLNAIGLSVKNVPAEEQLKLFDILWRFIRNNPNDGIPLVKYLGENINKVPYTYRTDFIKNVLNEYVRYYNNNLYGLKEATNHFFDKIDWLEPDRVPLALKIYYKLYRNNNKERAREIERINRDYNQKLAEIDRQYQTELAQAQADYLRAKYKKQSWREWSYKGIFSGFISLLLFSIVLLVLSMIRNVNRLTEAMYEQNYNIQQQLNNVLDKQSTPKSVQSDDKQKLSDITKNEKN